MQSYQFRFRFILILSMATILGCKPRVEQDYQTSFLTAIDGQPICEDLHSFVAEAGRDYDEALKKEMAKVQFREDFESIGDVFRKAAKDKVNKPVAKDFLVAEIAAIKAYTNAAYGPINSSLWKRECNLFKETSRLLASGINRSMAVKGSVYRGGEITQNDLDLNVYQVGKVVVAPAFSSSSLNKSVAERFVRNAFFEIKDATGGYVRPLSSWGNEEEVTFVPGTQFRVDGFEKTESNDLKFPLHYKISLTVISGVTQKTVVEYHPKSIDKAILAAENDKVLPTLMNQLGVIIPTRKLNGTSEFDLNSRCSVVFKKMQGSVQIEVTYDKFPGTSVTLESQGTLKVDSETYTPNKLWTHVEYRIPNFPAVVYHLATMVNGVATNLVSIYFGLKNDQLEMERVRVTSPKGSFVPACVVE